MTVYYTCAGCGGEFQSDRDLDEATREYTEGPTYIEGAEVDVVCDDCFKEFMDWFRKKEMI